MLDDDPQVQAVVGEALDRAGFDVAMPAIVARAQTRLGAGDVDLAIIDLVLPDGDGLDLIADLHAQGGIPVIALSGKAQEGDRILGFQHGADDYVSKPFSPRARGTG